MGIVSVMVCERLANELRVDIFVLSCRVIGYGIDRALLNWVKRNLMSDGENTLPIRGIIQETPQNQPCRDVYRENGFERQHDGQWMFRGEEVTQDDSWLTVIERGIGQVNRSR